MLPPLGFEDYETESQLYEAGLATAFLSFGGRDTPHSIDPFPVSPYVEAIDNFYFFLTDTLRSNASKLKAETAKIKNRLKRERLENTLRKKLGDIKHVLNEQPAVVLRQKISFTLGVANVIMTAFTLGYAPNSIPSLYALDFLLLYSLRVYLYRRRGWQYFTLDLCYWVNVMLLTLMFFIPTSEFLLGGVIGLVHGPVLWAILQWRNSLVFHSLDKITSCFIHFCPAVVLYGLRWLSSPGGNGRTWLIRNSSPSLSLVMGASTLFYALWQGAYYVVVNIKQREKIEAGARVTSYTWLVSHGSEDTLLYKVVNIYGPSYRLIMYMLTQLVYTLVTALPTFLVWRSQLLHSLLLGFMFLVCVWNGATYYVDVFSHSYAQTVVRIHQDLLKEVDGSETGSGECSFDGGAKDQSPVMKD
eukprot:Blabericola_migrator_1__13306@NODE_933_length_5987_cov_26_727196_g649_i0_p2_GENE_NODE_933_length_5987_cov_26_727196_g649_i0NODE_933_length_5987_cov_26_727196_g649_i0_p2_ORF_typecomplete_len415_score72_91DUF2838/PF10998_8/5_7e35DUF2838/PF10998_8/1_3e03MCLC/PF05934_11/2_2e03MCLC/PF05934_11/0_26Itfg2/PF15907_5/4S_2TMBeta/PF18153_1/7_1e02S_2TMBeta/PF18153_1/0_74_NODE_933_length_5987_cov_26_727196_g649_i046715915